MSVAGTGTSRVAGGGPLRPPGTTTALATLCVTVTTSYGILFYSFPVLAPAIAADTGWSLSAVTAVFSASQVAAGLGGRLTVETDRGDRFSAPALVAATGAFSHPHRPPLPGIEEFTGTVLHAAD